MFSLFTVRHAPVRLLAAGASAALLVALVPASAQAAGGNFGGDAPAVAAAESDDGTVVEAPSAPAAPVDVEQTTVPSVEPAAAEADTDDVVAELGETKTANYRMVGVVWSPEAAPSDVTVQVRTRTGGAWSEWIDLEVDDDHGSTEGGNPGTEPLWVGQADGVAARLSSSTGTPQNIRITTIDPGASGESDDAESDQASGAGSAAPADAESASPALYSSDMADGTAYATATADGTPSRAPKPSIISRSSWGASSGTYCSSPQVGSTTKGVVIHHTAGSNSYSASQSRSIVRGIQAYHTKSRGWCDIGYNFLVDKYGQIFEGRRGGVDRNVRAAHSGNGDVNTYTMGVSLMGNLDKVKPTSAMKSATVKLVGWRMGAFYLDAKGTYSLGGKRLNMIAGHRNVVSTGCPGKYGYAWLSESGGLRDRVEDYLSKVNTPIEKMAKSLGTAKTGLPYVGEYPATGGYKTRFSKMDIYDKSGVGTHYVSDTSKFRDTYVSFNAQRSPLGFPRTSTPAASSRLTIQRFEHGSMYAVPSEGVFGVWGATYKIWGTLKGSRGVLGEPRTSVGAEKSGKTRTEFEGGYIIADVNAGSATAYSPDGDVISGDGESGGSPTPPSAVSKPTATASATSATWTWDPLADATSYQACVVPALSAKHCWQLKTVTGTDVVFDDLFPTKGVDWYVHVRAKNDAGYGPWSAYGGVDLLLREPVKPPAAVSKPTATALDTSATWTWDPLADATSYQACVVPALSAKHCWELKTVTGTSVTFDELFPTKGVDWYVHVRAKNDAGYGPWSAYGGVDLPLRDPVKPSATATSTTATWTWPAVDGATSYQACMVPALSAKHCWELKAVTGTSVTFDKLFPTKDTDWYVHVRAKRGSTYTGWSPYGGVNLASPSASSSSSVTVPSSRKVSISGHGYGHGIGMSQYGAEGAAQAGWNYSKILDHYYSGTALSTKTGDIKVLISADTSDGVLVNGQSGLKLRDISGARTVLLPTSIGGKTVVRWHIVQTSRGSSKSKLMYRTGSTYVDYKVDGSTLSWSGDGYFYGPSVISLVLPDNSVMKLRGKVRSAKPSSGSGSRDTINHLSIEDYVRGVIAAEMPAGWHTEALKAQAVAARTYGVRSMGTGRYYDICSTTACQVYKGYSRETSKTDAAVKGTAGKILTYRGAPAVTQFSSSSGGYTASSASVSTYPYLSAVKDPYDGWSGNANHDWKITVSASKIESKYPAIGTLKKMSITKRTGDGDWGGRVSSLVLTGSKRSVTISGNDARWAFGLRSNWFTF